nr:unnamed protein product [Callosobruchus analis]
MLQGVIIMNPNNHNPPRRNSSSFNRHANNHSNRSSHHNNHQRWSGRYPKEYNREYDNGFGRGALCQVQALRNKTISMVTQKAHN